MSGSDPKRYIPWAIVCCIIGGLLIAFPPFHVISRQEWEKKNKPFDPEEYAIEFWNETLPQSFDNASDAKTVLEAIVLDRNSAKEQYAKYVGFKDGPYHFYIKGTGEVTAINEFDVELSLAKEDGSSTDIVLMTSMIFGNEILDATGLISRNDFAISNVYNSISRELNKIVKSEVALPFREKATMGSTVHFLGCSSKISDDDPIPIPMHLVPVKLEVE